MRKINETPIGLPCVFLHPNVIDFKDGDILHPGLKNNFTFRRSYREPTKNISS